MHAYRKIVDEQMKAGRMSQSELSRASGLSRQRVSQILNDDRERLVQVPDTATVEGLAKAFKLAPEVVWVAVAEAMGLPSFVVPPITHEVKDVDDAQLLAELGKRLDLEVTVRPAGQADEGKKMGDDLGVGDGVDVILFPEGRGRRRDR